jgi:hypothetical protein
MCRSRSKSSFCFHRIVCIAMHKLSALVPGSGKGELTVTVFTNCELSMLIQCLGPYPKYLPIHTLHAFLQPSRHRTFLIAKSIMRLTDTHQIPSLRTRHAPALIHIRPQARLWGSLKLSGCWGIALAVCQIRKSAFAYEATSATSVL